MDLFDIPAAFLIGALTGTGVGGGGLLVLYLTFECSHTLPAFIRVHVTHVGFRSVYLYLEIYEKN